MEPIHLIWQGDSSILGQHFQAKRKIRSVITDPPFGIDNQSNSAVTPDGKAQARKIANDSSPEVAMATFSKVMKVIIPGMMDDSDIYVFTSYHVLEDWLKFTRELFTPFGFERKSIGVWEKDGPGMGDTTYRSWGNGLEFILYYKRGNRESAVKRRNFVLHHSQIRPGDLIHPHEKPGPLLVELIQHSTDPGELVVDPFGGSGSLVRAARDCGRSAVAIELDQYNYEQAVKKLESTTGGLF